MSERGNRWYQRNKARVKLQRELGLTAEQAKGLIHRLSELSTKKEKENQKEKEI